MSFDVINHWNTLFMQPRRLVEPGSWVRHFPFAFLLIALSRPRTLVELGVHSGNSFCAFCQAVRYFQTSTLCYGVDTFQGDDQAGQYEDGIYIDLQNHVQEHYQDFAQLMRMTFDQAERNFTDGSVDFLHIDGLHTYEAVRHDFDTWLPKLSGKGLVLFHDLSVRDGDFGVWQLWDEVRDSYPSLAFRHGHGLGLLAVGGEIPEPVREFIEAMRHDERLEHVFVAAGDRLAQMLQIADCRSQRDHLLHELAAANQEIVESRKFVDHLRQTLDERDTLIKDQDLHIQALREQHSGHVEQIRNLELARDGFQHHNQELEARYQHFLNTYEQSYAELEQRRQQQQAESEARFQRIQGDLAAVHASLSWLLTAPLRGLGGLFRS